MFTIIISEKGGAERRESFEKNEINVGRVQGNDLMLPKGNVSKHHARLLFRDGRFIVTDLKSTNGTYVNGRKIAQATIVREGDKIYIGDFVVRLDTGTSNGPISEAADPASSSFTGEEPSSRDRGERSAGTAPPGLLPGSAGFGPETGAMEAASDDGVPTADRLASSPKVPAPPRTPDGVPGAMLRGGTLGLPNTGSRGAAPAYASPVPARNAPQTASPVPPAVGFAGGNVTADRLSSPSRLPPRETAAQAGRRLALVTLVDRVADVVDLAPLKSSPVVDAALSESIERAAREQAKAMKDEGEAPEGIDTEILVRDAVLELTGFGPIGPLLDEDDVVEIHCLRHDQLYATRGGTTTMSDASFTSEEAFARVIARLVHQSGEPRREGEWTLERRLPRGARMLALVPPVSSASVLVVRKRRRVDATLEDFVRVGALSKPMASFLEAVVAGRVNALVAAPTGLDAGPFIGALVSAVPTGERSAIVQDDEQLNIAHNYAIALSMPDDGERGDAAVRAAARLHVEHIVVGSLSGKVAATTVESLAGASAGVLGLVAGASLRQATARLVGHLTLSRPAVSPESARDFVGEAFEVGIELGRSPDGRLRVLRIAELSGGDPRGVVTRDVFTVGDGATGTETAFVALGVVPRVVGELASRGQKLDQNLFKRGPSR
ncbi:MAG: FHA domain-containing protein [Polyangiaceae bacterium]